MVLLYQISAIIQNFYFMKTFERDDDELTKKKKYVHYCVYSNKNEPHSNVSSVLVGFV